MKFSEITDTILDAWKQGMDISLSVDEVGVYPAAVNDIPRDKYGDGWNACSDAKLDKRSKFMLFLDSISIAQQKALLYLLINDDLSVINSKDGIKLFINCNDRFYHACSDGEECQIGDLEFLCLLYDRFEYEGLLAWIFVRRTDCPRPCVRCVDVKRFDFALEFLNATN